MVTSKYKEMEHQTEAKNFHRMTCLKFMEMICYYFSEYCAPDGYTYNVFMGKK